MSIAPRARDPRTKRATRAVHHDHPDTLPNWSEVTPAARRTCDGACSRPSPRIAAILTDLISWIAETSMRLIHANPDDREAIDQAARYARAWLAGAPVNSVQIEDVLTTVAALVADLDRAITRTDARDPSDRHNPAVGA